MRPIVLRRRRRARVARRPMTVMAADVGSAETRLSSAREPRDRPRHQAVRRTTALDRPDLRGRARRGLRLPRRQRRGQDDDDADLPRDRPRRRRRDPLGRPAVAELPRRTWGYLPEERGLYPRMTVLDQLVYFGSLYGDAARSRPARGDRLADPLPHPRLRRPSRRGAVQGQPAEGPVHRGGPPRPRGPADGRAVHRARPGQPRPPARGVHGAARPRPDAHLLDPPDGGGRGAVRIGRDRRPRAARRRRPGARPQARQRAADAPARHRRRPVPPWLAALPGSTASGRARTAPSSSCCPAPTRRRSSPRSSAAGRGHPVRGRRAEPRGALHRARRPPVRRRRRRSRPVVAAPTAPAGGLA